MHIKSNPKSFVYFIDAGTNEKMIGAQVANENSKCLLSSINGKGFIIDNLSSIEK